MELSSETQVPGVDLDEARVRLMDDVPFLLSLLHELVEHAIGAEQTFQLSGEAPDFEDALRKLHQIRGGAANLAAKRVEHHASRLETLIGTIHRATHPSDGSAPELPNPAALRDMALLRTALKTELLSLRNNLATALGHKNAEESHADAVITQRAETLPAESTRRNKVRILIIDDSDTMRSYLEATLQKELPDVTIDKARDGLSGLQKLTESPPDLVLCDLQMPEFDGLKLLQMRKNRPEIAGIPFIMLTAEDDIDRKIDVLRRGASDYITKPFHGQELIARAQIHLKQKRLQDELRDALELIAQLRQDASASKNRAR